MEAETTSPNGSPADSGKRSRARAGSDPGPASDAKRDGGSRSERASDSEEGQSTREDVSIQVEIPAVKRGRGRPAGAGKKQTRQEAETAAAMFLLLIEGAAVSLVGSKAAFTDGERKMIAPGLAGLLQKAGGGVAEKINSWSEILLLAFGFGSWALRILPTPKVDPAPSPSGSARPVQTVKTAAPVNGKAEDFRAEQTAAPTLISSMLGAD